MVRKRRCATFGIELNEAHKGSFGERAMSQKVNSFGHGNEQACPGLPKGEHTAKLLLLACCTQEVSRPPGPSASQRFRGEEGAKDAACKRILARRNPERIGHVEEIESP